MTGYSAHSGGSAAAALVDGGGGDTYAASLRIIGKPRSGRNYTASLLTLLAL